MFDELRTMLGRIDADYADIRYEIMNETVISYEGRRLSCVGSNATDGYVLRVLKGGGMASVVFTTKDDVNTASRKALENARLIGRHTKDPVRMAKVELVRDSFTPPLIEDPRDVSLEEKRDLVRSYVEIPFKHERIASLSIDYREIVREKYLATSEGTEIHEDLITTRLTGEIMSRDGSLVQNVRVAAGYTF